MAIRVRAYHVGLDKMFSPEEMAQDQLTLLPTGQFINVNSSIALMSQIFDPVDQMIPMLSSGSFDVDGNELYQGDIIEFTKTASVVSMSDPNPDMRIIGVCEETRTLDFLQMDFSKNRSGYTYCVENLRTVCRRVGNIHQNKEMLVNQMGDFLDDTLEDL